MTPAPSAVRCRGGALRQPLWQERGHFVVKPVATNVAPTDSASASALPTLLWRSLQLLSSRSQCLQLADMVSDELGGTGYALAIAALFDELVAYGIEAIQ